jgi:hypothetical protein
MKALATFIAAKVIDIDPELFPNLTLAQIKEQLEQAIMDNPDEFMLQHDVTTTATVDVIEMAMEGEGEGSEEQEEENDEGTDPHQDQERLN